MQIFPLNQWGRHFNISKLDLDLSIRKFRIVLLFNNFIQVRFWFDDLREPFVIDNFRIGFIYFTMENLQNLEQLHNILIAIISSYGCVSPHEDFFNGFFMRLGFPAPEYSDKLDDVIILSGS